jgi:predicted MFS family arabinose efflux permease
MLNEQEAKPFTSKDVRFTTRDDALYAIFLDWPGQFTLSGGLFLLVLALLRGNAEGWSSAVILAELGAAVALLGAFVAIESRVSSPMLPLGLFRRSDFSGAQVAAFAISGSLFAIFLYTSIYLQSVLGLSALEAGLVYLPATVVMFVVSGASAQYGNRVAPGLPIAGGLVLNAAGLALMTVVGADSSWAAILPGIIVACIGTGLLNPALSAVALSSAPQEQSGLAAGVNDTFRQAGIAVGVAAFGAMIPAESIFGGGAGSAVDYVDGMHTALWVGFVLSLVGAVACARLIGLGRAPVVAEAAA